MAAHWSPFLVAVAVCLNVPLVLPAGAASFTVSPIRIELPPDGKPAVVRVRNDDEIATLVQVEAVPWTENIDSVSRTSEILAVPPVFELPVNGEQILRVALREPLQGDSERAYRLLITEVPRAMAEEGVTFALRLDLPLFVTPAGASPDPSWTIRHAPDGPTELVLRNEGQAHVRVSKLTLHETGASAPILTIDEPATTLAGKEHRWSLDRPAHSLPEMLQVRAETQRGELVLPVARSSE